MKNLTFTLFIIGCFCPLFGQTNVALVNSDEFVLYSQLVEDSFFIQVSLPSNYSNDDQEYPVIYLLDSDPSFGMAKGICEWLKFDGLIPNVIIVGIAYKKGWWQKRSRDYTPTKVSKNNWGEWPISGGADNFLAFIDEELNPSLVEYRINWENKTIIGHSFGGVLATYALFTKPELFDNYLSISPALIWDDYFLSKLANEVLGKKSNESYVFTAIGDLDSEEIVEPWEEFNEQINMLSVTGLKWESKKYENQSHSSVLPIAISDGLRKVFNK